MVGEIDAESLPDVVSETEPDLRAVTLTVCKGEALACSEAVAETLCVTDTVLQGNAELEIDRSQDADDAEDLDGDKEDVVHEEPVPEIRAEPLPNKELDSDTLGVADGEKEELREEKAESVGEFVYDDEAEKETETEADDDELGLLDASVDELPHVDTLVVIVLLLDTLAQ